MAYIQNSDAMAEPDDIQGDGRPVSESVGAGPLFQALPIAVIVTDSMTGAVIAANPAAGALLGVDTAGLTGKTLSEAAVDIVIDYGVGGRKGARAQQAIVTDSLGSRVACSMFSSTVEVAGRNAVVTVLLDTQLEAVLTGRSARAAKARQSAAKKEEQAAGANMAVILDPSESSRESAAEMLRMLGMEVISAPDADVLFDSLPSNRKPTLAVVDSSRLEDAEDVLSRFPGTPVIVALSAGSRSKELVRGRGWSDVPKPFSINDLAQAVSRILSSGARNGA